MEGDYFRGNYDEVEADYEWLEENTPLGYCKYCDDECKERVDKSLPVYCICCSKYHTNEGPPEHAVACPCADCSLAVELAYMDGDHTALDYYYETLREDTPPGYCKDCDYDCWERLGKYLPFFSRIVEYNEREQLDSMRTWIKDVRRKWTASVIAECESDLSYRAPIYTNQRTQKIMWNIVPGLYQAIGCEVTLRTGDISVEWPQDEVNESLMLMISREVWGARTIYVSFPYLVVESLHGYRIAYNLWRSDSTSSSSCKYDTMASSICASGYLREYKRPIRCDIMYVLRDIGNEIFGHDIHGEAIDLELMSIFGRDGMGRSKMLHYQAVMAGLYTLEDRLPFGEVTLFGSSAYYIFRTQVCGSARLHISRDREMPKDLDICVTVDDFVEDKAKAFIDFVRITLSVITCAAGGWDPVNPVRNSIRVCKPQPHILRTELVVYNPYIGPLVFDLSMRFKVGGKAVAFTPVVMRQCVSYRFVDGIRGCVGSSLGRNKIISSVVTLPILTIPIDCSEQGGHFITEQAPSEYTFFRFLTFPMACLYFDTTKIPKEQTNLVHRLQDRHGPILNIIDTVDDCVVLNVAEGCAISAETRQHFIDLEAFRMFMTPTLRTYSESPQLVWPGCPTTFWDIPQYRGFRIIRMLENKPRDGY